MSCDKLPPKYYVPARTNINTIVCHETVRVQLINTLKWKVGEIVCNPCSRKGNNIGFSFMKETIILLTAEYVVPKNSVHWKMSDGEDVHRYYKEKLYENWYGDNLKLFLLK